MPKTAEKKASTRKRKNGPDPAWLKKLYKHMIQLRTLDERLLGMQRQGRIGFFGTTTGEEAAIVGTAAGFEGRDWVFPALRQGGVMLWRGFPLSKYIAQCIGNSMDVLKGRQMPSHFADREVNVVSWSSCIANQLPQATGAAHAIKLRGDDAVAVGYVGDGGTSEPDFHAALNFAGVWNVPAVFIVQNNQWAISVPRSIQTASENFAMKADAYGIRGVQVDGNDVLEVQRVTKEAMDRAREKHEPTLIETTTYRLGGHSSSDDPTRYRDPQEVEKAQKNDPIERFRKFLFGKNIFNKKSDEAFRKEIKEEVNRAVKEAESAAPVDPSTMFDDVYAEQPWNLKEQREELRREFAERKEGAKQEGAFPL